MDDDTRYCAEQVRRLDPYRYLAALFAPEPARADLLALYAFNLELATVREQVREPLAGMVRLQWWRDAIDGISRGEARETPVARALARAVVRGHLTPTLLDRLIDARERDLDETPPEPFAYAEATGGTLAALAVEALGLPGARDAAHHAGTAWALVGLMRVDRVSGAVFVDEARRRLAAARALPLPPAALPALAQLAVAEAWLRRRREPTRFGAQLRIAWRAWRGRL